MSVPMAQGQILRLLDELDGELFARNLKGHVFLVGGAAICLAYDARRMTADLDGTFEPKQAVYDAAERVAARHPGLPPNWLNDSVKGLLPPGVPPVGEVVHDGPGLTVSVPPARYLLALKVHAARVGRDQDDIAFLANEVGATTADEILLIAEDVIGKEQLAPKSQFIIQELFPALIEPPPAGGAPEPSDGVPSG